MARTGAWMRGNLTTQGNCLTDAEHRELAVGLRFSHRVVPDTRRRRARTRVSGDRVRAQRDRSRRRLQRSPPFDHLWNHGVRRVVGGPAQPPSPARRRHAFKIATAWLLVVGTLLAAGAATAGSILGGLLVAACATVTATNLCLPSETFAWWARHTQRTQAITT
jgi:hypothetical protein